MKKYVHASILLGTMVLGGCSENGEMDTKQKVKDESKVLAEKLDKHVSNMDKEAVKKTIPLLLTQEQKEVYYKQYKEIVEEANNTKIGIGLDVPPISDFKPEDWVEPKEYKNRVQKHIDSFLANERKALNALPSTTTEAVMGMNGETKKTAHLYVSDIIFSVEVTGRFETQYNEAQKGQVFSNVDRITSHIASSSHGDWVQTSYDVSRIDNGRTYNIRIEGIYKNAGIATQKAFSIGFNCGTVGDIH
ncbi:hypothetical protein [Bacillus sp. 1P06AnD]|uniref:hypothetical protein n=1 Tax=Bacillus sp. 1P06AnD TaxID=3132208 RepID=UPI0039A2FA63